MEKRVFARSVAEHLIPCNVLICSSNEAASGAAAAVGFTVVVKLTITHCHSSEPVFLLHRPKRIVEWRCGGNHQACTFQVLNGGIVLYNPFRNVLLFFGLLFFLNRESANGFWLVFATIIVLTSHQMMMLCI